MDRYENGKIYKIVDNTTGKIYIGSTCLPTLAKRLVQHRDCYNRYLKGGYRYISSVDILKNNDYSIILLEEYPCQSKDQLLARERYFIDNNECVNKRIPGRTDKEYNEENKDKRKEYYDTNKDKIKEQKKIYYDTNKDKRKEKCECECGGKYTYNSKSHHLKTKKHQEYLEDKLV